MNENSTAESRDASDAALQQQLSELNRRSHIYSTRLWQTPLAFFTVVGIVFGLAEGSMVSPEWSLTLVGVLGVLLAGHMYGMRDGTKRAVENIQTTEASLGLAETAQWKPTLYIDLLIVLVAGAGSLMLGMAAVGWFGAVSLPIASPALTTIGAWYGILPTVGELCGVALGAYGLLRESFADLAAERPFGEGRYGEGAYGGRPSRIVRGLVRVGVWARLLPPDRQMTVTDRKRNAALAITGLFILMLSMAGDLILQVTTQR